MPSCRSGRTGWPRARRRGVGHGDRVALLLYNGIEFVESLLACHNLGAVAVPVNFRLARDEIDLHTARLRRRRADQRAGRPTACTDAAPAARGRDASYDDASRPRGPTPNRPHWSRTTRVPVLHLRHDRPAEGRHAHPPRPGGQHPELDSRGARGPRGRVAVRPPLFHIGGVNGLLPFLALGATCIVTPATGFDPARRSASCSGHARDDVLFVPDPVGRDLRRAGCPARPASAAGGHVGRLAGDPVRRWS